MTQQSSLPLHVSVPEGVHLHMPAHVFEDALAIGPSDLRGLYWDAASWWAASSHNPLRKPPPRGSRRLANHLDTALCTLVLEGEEAYAARFAVEPDDGSNKYAYTRDQVRALLETKGARIPHGDFTDKTLYGLVRKHGLQHKVFALVRQEYEAARRSGRGHITDEEDQRLRRVARLMFGHKDLGKALTGGLSEVSVFWRRSDDPETLLRARFHKLRPRRSFTITPLANWKGRSTDNAIRHAIEDGDHDIQRRLLPEAFEALSGFVRDGLVHGWDANGRSAAVLAEETAALKQIADAGPPECWWIFVQIPSDEIGRERGLVIAPRVHQPQGRFWEAGGEKIEKALEEYRKFRDGFGLDRPWAVVDDAKELTDDDVRSRQKRENA